MIRRVARIVFVLLVASAAAFAGWSYGLRPVWASAAFGPCHQVLFAPTGREVVSIHDVDPEPDGRPAVRLVRRETDSSRLTGDCRLAWDGPTPAADFAVQLVGTDRVALGHSFAGAAPNCRIQIHDAATGRKLHGPFPASPGPFLRASPDGRWVMPGGQAKRFVADATKPSEVWRYIDSTPGQSSILGFSPDGGRLAVVQWAGPAGIDVYDLNAGGLPKRFALPAAWSGTDCDWADDDRIYVRLGDRVVSFGTGDADFGVERAEPWTPSAELGTMWWQVGRGWVVVVSQSDVSDWRIWADKAIAQIGYPGFSLPGVPVRVQHYDPATGRPAEALAVMPRDPRQVETVRISPDGRRVAVLAPGDGVAVYSFDASPATWAVGCGVAALATTTLLTRRRSRRPVIAPS
jgi:hypothetical protein